MLQYVLCCGPLVRHVSLGADADGYCPGFLGSRCYQRVWKLGKDPFPRSHRLGASLDAGAQAAIVCRGSGWENGV